MGGTVVELGLPAGEFALSETASRFEGLAYEIERVVAHDADHVMPYVWIDGPSVGDVEAALAEDDSVDGFTRIAEIDDERLYRMRWVGRIDTLVRILVDEEGAILSAQGNGDDWRLRVLFPDREALSRTYEYCTERGLSMELHAIYDVDDGRRGRYGLTDEQQDALLAASEHGYYEIPRKAGTEAIAAELGISHQALSERLRRGHRALVANTVVIGDREPEATTGSAETPEA